MASRMRALMVFVCLLASCFGATPGLAGLITPGGQPLQEELETHPEVRFDSPRQVRLRTIPDAAIAPIPRLGAVELFHCRQRLPHSQKTHCLVDSGIRLHC